MRRLFNHQVLLLVLVALAPAATAQIITTVAGNGGTPSFSGDGGPATSARLALPTGVAADAAGNLFITDQTNQRIRRVDAISGIITTVAGSGGEGFSGDGGLATSASFNAPLGIAVDAMGNLFIADQLNHRIRKVDAISGIITTVAGSGVEGFSGDGGLATNASLRFASGVLVDAAGDLYIADRNNQRIRKVDAISGIITTVAGTGVQAFGGDGGSAIGASFSSPVDVALDQAGNLFICDQLNERIRRVDAITGTITTVAGNGGTPSFSGDGGPATLASFNLPLDVTVDGAGNLFIADLFNHRIRKVDAMTGIITTVAGNGVLGFAGDGGPATSASLAGPRSLAVGPAGNLFIADLFNHRIRKVGLTPALIEELIEDVKALGLKGMAGQAQLNAALDALSQDPPDIQGAIIALQSFISFVNAQSGKKIPTQDAEDLIAHAQVIIEILQGS